MSHSLLLTQGNGFWNPMSLWDVSSASGSLTVARGRHGHF